MEKGKYGCCNHSAAHTKLRDGLAQKTLPENRTISRAIRRGCVCSGTTETTLPRTQTPGNGDDGCGRRREGGNETPNKISDKWIGGEREGRK